jgi:heme-degrading monooxygenase HmoA
MTNKFYTHALWRVKPGQQPQFVEAWTALGQIFAKLPGCGPGTLIQSISDATLFYSFGPWSSLQAIEAMRRDPDALNGIQRVKELCDEAVPGTYQVVGEVNP